MKKVITTGDGFFSGLISLRCSLRQVSDLKLNIPLTFRTGILCSFASENKDPDDPCGNAAVVANIKADRREEGFLKGTFTLAGAIRLFLCPDVSGGHRPSHQMFAPIPVEGVAGK